MQVEKKIMLECIQEDDDEEEEEMNGGIMLEKKMFKHCIGRGKSASGRIGKRQAHEKK